MKNKFDYRITFFTTTLGRTGSEIVLRNLLDNINPKFDITVITKYKITEQLLSPSIRTNYLNFTTSKLIWNRILNRLYRLYKLSRYKNSIWYVNTIVMPDIISYAKKNNIQLVLHVHELEHMYELLSKEQIQNIIHYPGLIIANSKTSERVLNSLGRKSRIQICYPAINTTFYKKNNNIKIEYRNKLKIKPEQFVWVMSGTLDENKNPLLFIEVANELVKIYPNVLFLWIGTSPFKEFEMECNQKVISMGLTDNIKWIFNSGKQYFNYFNCADGFFLTSKRESFSLVTIEALLLQLPIVTQDNGGVNEILKDDIGKIVRKENDAKAIAEEMFKFMNGTYTINKELQIQRALEFDITIWSKKWNEILLNYFENL